MIEILKELDDAFRDITYYDEPHVYTIRDHNEKMRSVTGLLSDFKEKFDADFWAQRKADDEGVTKEDKLEEWRVINKIATTKGTIIHNYIENLLAGKIFPYPKDYVISEVGKENEHIVLDKVLKLEKMANSFISDIAGKLLPIKSELVVGDQELGVCGMVDQLFYNYKQKEMQIWDWKTNKKLRCDNEYGKKLKGLVSHLDECEFTIYSLQLSIYREIIHRKTNLDIGKTYIVWFFEENETYKVIECLDLREEAKLILEKMVVNN